MLVIYRKCDTKVIARYGGAEAISWCGMGLPRPDKSGLAMTRKEGLAVTGRRAQDDTRFNTEEQKLSAVLSRS